MIDLRAFPYSVIKITNDTVLKANIKGMTIELNEEVKVKIGIKEYMCKIIDILGPAKYDSKSIEVSLSNFIELNQYNFLKECDER